MIVAEDSGSKARRTRRNVLKASAILAPAVLARITSARAHPVSQCFLKGTKIETAKGERKAEDLAIGDLLPTKFGGTRPIQWIGRFLIKKTDPSKPWVKDALPVRIARSALGPNVPHADLYVTGAHCLLIDGVLVPAEMLINGTTIERFDGDGHDELEFFHIKLESHDVIYAEGAPAETLLNVDERAVNFADYFRRYGPSTTEARCAPVVCIGGRGELKSRIRSAISPWLDRREQADTVRDRLEERGIAAFSPIGQRCSVD
jgi:Hint domain